MLLVNPYEYTEWFMKKFRTTYHHRAFPEQRYDYLVLATLIDMVSARTACEIGTWKGDTGLFLYLHPLIERVKCIDIHKDMGVAFTQPNHQLMDKDEYGMMYKNTFVHLQFADTMTYPRGQEQHDLVFIDAAHDYEHVKNDTELALSWNPKCVAWHDYNNGNEGVTKYIDECIAAGDEIMQFPKSCIVATKLNC